MKRILVIRALFVVVLIGIFTVLLGGCTVLEDFQNWKNGVVSEAKTEGKPTDSAQQPVVLNQDGSPTIPNAQPAAPPAASVAEPKKEKSVVLYFGVKEGSGLQPVTRSITTDSGIAKATLAALIGGPKADEDTVATIPAGTILRGVNIKEDGTCLVDFNSKLLSDNQSAELAVYSVVNTLSQFSSVSSVQILIDGKQVDKTVGTLDISEAVMADLDFGK